MLIFCYSLWMVSKVTINERGVITIPAPLRRALGLKADDELLIEATPQGLLLRPSVTMPVEIYTDERIAEFTREEDAVAEILDRKTTAEK